MYKHRFIEEYYNFKIRVIERAPLMNPGIKREILRRMENAKQSVRRGFITVDEYMRLLSYDCCGDDEDMSEYMEEGWEPYSDMA
jgi:hypothetical protein